MSELNLVLLNVVVVVLPVTLHKKEKLALSPFKHQIPFYLKNCQLF